MTVLGDDKDFGGEKVDGREVIVPEIHEGQDGRQISGDVRVDAENGEGYSGKGGELGLNNIVDRDSGWLVCSFFCSSGGKRRKNYGRVQGMIFFLSFLKYFLYVRGQWYYRKQVRSKICLISFLILCNSLFRLQEDTSQKTVKDGGYNFM
jgi:hypothetical protein